MNEPNTSSDQSKEIRSNAFRVIANVIAVPVVAVLARGLFHAPTVFIPSIVLGMFSVVTLFYTLLTLGAKDAAAGRVRLWRASLITTMSAATFAAAYALMNSGMFFMGGLFVFSVYLQLHGQKQLSPDRLYAALAVQFLAVLTLLTPLANYIAQWWP